MKAWFRAVWRGAGPFRSKAIVRIEYSTVDGTCSGVAAGSLRRWTSGSSWRGQDSLP
jgi:hypothetical protein